VSSQHTTRTTMMTNQSTKLLKQANIICAHSIPIAPKHDHLNTTNYVWDRSFPSKTVIHTRSMSPHFSFKSSLFATTSQNKKQSSLATINDRLCQQGLSSPLSSSSNNKAQDPQDCSQSASRIIKIFFVIRSTSRSQQHHLS
jgi:hypothetical protein